MKEHEVRVEVSKTLGLTSKQRAKLASLFNSALVEVISGPLARPGKKAKDKQKQKQKTKVEILSMEV